MGYPDRQAGSRARPAVNLQMTAEFPNTAFDVPQAAVLPPDSRDLVEARRQAPPVIRQRKLDPLRSDNETNDEPARAGMPDHVRHPFLEDREEMRQRLGHPTKLVFPFDLENDLEGARLLELAD